MADLAALRERNAARWDVAKLTRKAELTKVAKRLVEASAKARYAAIEQKTGVPWYFVAVVHEREASQSWRANLAQGDPWNHVSTHVPKGRGPFQSWEDAAVDALTNCAPHAAHNRDWSIGTLLTLLEQYNGLGYANKGQPSPYLWSGTDQYTSGKFVSDHHYDASAVDHQLGCAGLLKAMAALDTSIVIAPHVGPQEQGTVTADRLNVRDGAGMKSPVLSVLRKGDVVSIAHTTMNGRTKWLQVTSGHQEGWVAAAYVETAPGRKPGISVSEDKTMAPATQTKVTVPVVSAWSSKINWTSVVSGLAIVLTATTGGKVNLSADAQLTIVGVIGAIQTVALPVLRTFFTKSVTPSSLGK